MGRLIPLTAKKINGQVLSRPKVVYLQEDAMKVIPARFKTGRGCKVVEELINERNVYEVYEKPIHIEAMRNPSSTDVIVKQEVNLGLSGAGTTQGAGTVLVTDAYLHEATTIGAGATEAFVLPAATGGKVLCFLNNDAAADAAKVFPASGEFINAQAVNTVLSIAGRDRVHFVCPTTAGKWVTAEDLGK